MSDKLILTVLGARPQFIKAAALSRQFKREKGLVEKIIHTGQHFDENMSDVFFSELQIPTPFHNLKINGGTHGQMTGKMIDAIEKIFITETPDAVLVYGDTNTTLATAIAASKLHIPIIHVEAGLRSYNRKMPEEINRVLTDHVSSLLLCPTKTSVDNLIKEGITQNVFHVGDVMCDATFFAKDHIAKEQTLHQKMSFLPKRFALMTVHREESTNEIGYLREMLNFAIDFADRNELRIVFPVHPRTKKIFDNNLSDSHFLFLDPLSYFEMQFCLSKAEYVITDSGGLQKEAYFHRVPCITLRSETEWVETIDHGWNRLWTVPDYLARKDICDYGTGQSAVEIVKLIRGCLL